VLYTVQYFNSDENQRCVQQVNGIAFMEFIVIQCFNSDIHSNVLTLMSTKVTSNRIMDSSGISERF